MTKDTGLDVEAQAANWGSDSSDTLHTNDNRLNEVLSTGHMQSSLGIDPDVHIVDWDGPDDPGNPFNWPTKKKWLITAVALFGYGPSHRSHFINQLTCVEL